MAFRGGWLLLLALAASLFGAGAILAQPGPAPAQPDNVLQEIADFEQEHAKAMADGDRALAARIETRLQTRYDRLQALQLRTYDEATTDAERRSDRLSEQLEQLQIWAVETHAALSRLAARQPPGEIVERDVRNPLTERSDELLRAVSDAPNDRALIEAARTEMRRLRDRAAAEVDQIARAARRFEGGPAPMDKFAIPDALARVEMLDENLTALAVIENGGTLAIRPPDQPREPPLVQKLIGDVDYALDLAALFRTYTTGHVILRGACGVRRAQLNYVRGAITANATTGAIRPAVLDDWKARLAAEEALPCVSGVPVPEVANICPSMFPAGQVQPLSCRCPPGPHARGAWGSYNYSGDSGLCAAAQHAGVIGTRGGSIYAVRGPGRAYFVGNTRNGITSRYQNYSGFSIVFANTTDPVEERRASVPLCRFIYEVYPAAQRQSPITCRCLKGGPGFEGKVYGDGPYTDDSNICSAARHAGVLPVDADDGIVIATSAAGRSSWPSSDGNGIVSANWNGYREGLTVAAAPE